MPVIAPAQSSLRVMPTAPSVQPELFIQQPNPAAGMQMFEQAAKLPLLMEQIKMEKQRNKVESEKLKFAQLQTEYQTENFAKLAQQQQALDALNADAVRAKIAADQAQRQRYIAETNEINRSNQLVPTVGPLSGETVGMSTAPQPLADQTGVAPVTPVEDSGKYVRKYDGAKYGEALPAPVAAAPAVVDPIAASFARETAALPPIPQGMSPEQAEQIAARAEADRLTQEIHGKVTTVKGRSEVNKTRGEQLLKLQPKTATYRFWAGDFPVKVEARMVGEKPIRWVDGARPRIDVTRIYEEVPSQKAEDEKWTATSGSAEFITDAVTREADVGRLIGALEAVDKAETAEGIFDTPLLQAILPDKFLETVGSDLAKAKILARTVIQKSLRATLGAQFAFKEGEQMLDRGFNTRLNELGSADFTRSQLNDLAKEIITRHRRLEAASNYYDRYGTLYKFSPARVQVGPDDPLMQQVAAVQTNAPAAPKTTALPEAVKASMERVLMSSRPVAGGRPVL